MEFASLRLAGFDFAPRRALHSVIAAARPHTTLRQGPVPTGKTSYFSFDQLPPLWVRLPGLFLLRVARPRSRLMRWPVDSRRI